MSEVLLLKWGTVKGWSNLSDQSVEIMQRFFADGVPMSVATDRPKQNRIEILCELIDQFEGKIINDWTGKRMCKDKAKKYVLEYK